MPSKGGRRKKTRTHVVGPPVGAFGAPETELNEKVPKTFVLRKGRVHANVSDLVEEMRRLMEPNTARKLRERAKNTMKDYVAVSSVLGVTHLLVFSQTDKSLSFRVCRAPSGPTLTFKVHQFSLMKHVRALQKRPQQVSHVYKTAPLVVLNNFGDKEASSEVKLMKVILQNMFPSINVATVKLQDCRRVVMFNLDKVGGHVEMRHYAVRATPTGITRAIKKVVQAKVPDLHSLDDISEYIAGGLGGGASDSELEDEESKVMLPEDYVGRGNVKSQKCSIRLQELGPRLTLELMKVERGLGEGEVLYHSYVTKTQEEVRAQRAKMEEKDSLKRKRRAEQEENVARKKQTAEEAAAEKASRRRERAERAAARGDADESEESSIDEESEDYEGQGFQDMGQREGRKLDSKRELVGSDEESEEIEGQGIQGIQGMGQREGRELDSKRELVGSSSENNDEIGDDMEGVDDFEDHAEEEEEEEVEEDDSGE